MEKVVKHRFLNSMLLTALFVPLGFWLLHNIIAVFSEIYWLRKISSVSNQ